jgi:hypothetical protein
MIENATEGRLCQLFIMLVFKMKYLANHLVKLRTISTFKIITSRYSKLVFVHGK